MAQDSPNSIEVPEIQFKLHKKLQLFNVGGQTIPSNVNLLAAASSKGILFASNPEAAELKVFLLNELVDGNNKKPRVRTIALPGIANVIACSADGSMLAVSMLPLNGTAFLQIYSVACFTQPNVAPFYNVRLSPEENAYAVQLLWNPVLVGNFAVVLNNGSLGMYALKGDGNFEMHTLDKSQEVKCGCWSPKGKQIVLGFPNGKLQQFKPDLTPAKTIVCPVGVHPGPFDTIAVHWLSTFQFAAVFLQRGPDMSPSLYIVNAPKGGTPSYINYYDICYSACGPRAHQIVFTHIQQWNLLLMSSANGVEVGILGTRDAGDMPTWHQYTLLDEARIEMPLANKEETYPMGFTFDNSSAHQLTVAEETLPVMPMVYVLSTYGHLMSFNFLNLTPGAVDVCSPPPPVGDTSGQFLPLEELSDVPKQTESVPVNVGGAAESAFAFAPNAVTSTPAVKDKAAPLFGNFAPGGNVFGGGVGETLAFGAKAPAAGFGVPLGAGQADNMKPFGAATSTVPAFTGFGALNVENASSFGAFTAKPIDAAPAKPLIQTQQKKPQTIQPQPPTQATAIEAQKLIELDKPLYTVPATFNPPPVAATQQPHTQPQPKATNAPQTANLKPQLSSSEYDESVRQMIAVQIAGFELEMKQLSNQSKGLLTNLGNLDELKAYTKRLNDLQEINEQAKDRDFETDVQNLQHTLNEIYAMQAECRSKLDMFNNPDVTRLASMSNFDPINRRQLNKLQSYLATIQVHMQQLQQQIDAQWSNYQDLVRRNSKSKMHIPCLDGIYQRMGKLKDVLSRQRTKLNYIKTQLKQKGLICKTLDDVEPAERISQTNNRNALESLVDSMLSMSMSQVIDTNRSKLPPEKLKAIRDLTKDRRQITIIRPQRPDRVGINSEVVLETRLYNERKLRENAAKADAKQKQLEDKEKQMPKNANQLQTSLPKPTATKPSIIPAPTLSTFAPPVQALPTTASFVFGSTSPFVKTSAPFAGSGVGAKSDEPIKPFVAANLPDFGNAAAQPFAIGASGAKATGANSVLKEALATPISFSAKVISGDATNVAATNANAINNSNGNNMKPTATAITSTGQGFTTLATATAAPKPAVSNAFDKENAKPEAAAKPFTFGQSGVESAGGAAGVIAFGSKSALSGFGTAAAANTTAAKPSLFDNKLGVANSGSFSFSGFGNALSTPLATSVNQPIASTTTTPNTAASVTSTAGASIGFTFGGALPKTTSVPATSIFAASAKPQATADATASVAPALPTAATFGAPPDSTKPTPPAATTTSTSSSFATYSFNNGAWNLAGAGDSPTVATTQSSSSSPSPVTAPATTTTATAPSTEKTLAPAAPPLTAGDAVATKPDGGGADTLFGELNICKPNTATSEGTAKTTTPAAANIFAGFGATSIGSTSGAFSFTSTLGGGTSGGGVAGEVAKPVFGGSGEGSGAKPAFGLTANAFSFTGAAAAAAAGTAATPTPFGAATLPGATSAAATPFASTTPSTVAATTSTTTIAPPATTATAATTAVSTATSVPASVFATVAAATATTTTTASATLPTFGGLSVGTAASAAPTAPSAAAAAPAPAATTSIFGGTASFLTTPATSAAPPASTAPNTLFGGGAAVTAAATAGVTPSASSIFAAAAAATPASSSELFGSPTAAVPAAGASIFGGAVMPKPEQSVFGSPNAAVAAPAAAPAAGGTGIFAAAAAANPSPFGSPTAAAAGAGGGAAAAAAGGSIFGGGSGGATGFGASTNSAAGSIFGGGNVSSAPTNAFGAVASTAGSIFGGAKSPDSSNVFGSPTQPAVASGGSIFGQSSFGQAAPQAAGNLFGAAATQAAGASAFGGGGGSIFGGASSTGGSVFGGAGGQAATTPSTFGGFSQVNTGAPFGSPTPGAGSFAQAGSPSVAQSGFGSSPIFGGAATFGSPPAFGGQTCFGGAATFGSPKGFGSFATTNTATTSPNAFGGGAQKSNLFETLGSSESGLSFGNLAHASNPNAAKPTFGGSSFMNYRA